MIRTGTPVRIALFLVLSLLLWASSPLRPSSVDGTEEAADTEARTRLTEGLLLCAETIDLSDLALSAAALGALFTEIMNDTPELFHAAPRLSYSYDAEGLVLTVMPVYTLKGDALTEARRLYLDTLNACCAELDAARRDVSPCRAAWGEADTVVFLHEWMTARFDYDADPAADGREAENFDAYRLFRDGRGVCQAYALAFLALARAAGLEAAVVTSGVMDHAWNIVRVDGAWYHVDVTRDDPVVPEGASCVSAHDRLLLSDTALAARGYAGYALPGGIACADTRFEAPGGRAVLADVRGPLIPLPWGWYAVGADALPVPVSPASGAGSPGLPGDLDRDGALSPADLLLLHACADRLPDGDAASAALRAGLVTPPGAFTP